MNNVRNYVLKLASIMVDFSYEVEAWKMGYSLVFGVDEVGRGSLAGPVVAGAATLRIMNHESGIMGLGIDDSKRLSPKKRIDLIPQIKKYFYTSVGEASVFEINKLGIVRATQIAMRRAIVRIMNYELRIMGKIKKTYYILVDGYPVKGLPGGLLRQKAIVRGDQKSVSIAAASIIAKVYRDNLMVNLGENFPNYMWDKNKGYATKFHRQVLQSIGACRLHRTLFVDSIC